MLATASGPETKDQLLTLPLLHLAQETSKKRKDSHKPLPKKERKKTGEFTPVDKKKKSSKKEVKAKRGGRTPLQEFKRQTLEKKKALIVAKKKIERDLTAIEKDLGVLKRTPKK